MTWRVWLAVVVSACRARLRRAEPAKPAKRPKARTVAPYRRSDGTDELRRIH